MLFLGIILFGISLLVSWQFKRKASHYSEVGLHNNLSGAEIAQQMLTDNGIADVKVISVEGQLTDHYNPQEKTVNLSQDVYYGRSVLAAAVAAHECGHAVQHAKAYSWLQFRSAIVPAVSIASRWVQWVLLGGVLLLNAFPQLLLIGIVMFAAITLFSFITLPVEFDASKRAMAWLDTKGIVHKEEYSMARNALNWAASTYVVAAISSLATLLYYIWIFMGRRD
ncbi:MAG: zinc metallopeptidase [Bacteroidia bacterium]|nr:zinc metallopeptidase [Bacteroidia bacterium]